MLLVLKSLSTTGVTFTKLYDVSYNQLTRHRRHELVLTYYKLFHVFVLCSAHVALRALRYAARWYANQELPERENWTYELDAQTSL